jgi:hypothetical protein
MSYSFSVSLCICCHSDSLLRKQCLPSHCLATAISIVLLWLRTSSFQASCHNIFTLYAYTIYTRPLSVQVQYSRSCPVFSSSCYNGSLVTWAVVCLTTIKFKPLIFPVLGLTLSSVENICIFMVLYESWLHPFITPNQRQHRKHSLYC